MTFHAQAALPAPADLRGFTHTQESELREINAPSSRAGRLGESYIWNT